MAYFIGGPKDGQNLQVPKHLHHFEVPIPAPSAASLYAADVSPQIAPPVFRRIIYRQVAYVFFGRHVDAWICEGYTESDCVADVAALEYGADIARQLPDWMCRQREHSLDNPRRRIAGLLWIAETEFDLALRV